LKKIKFTEITEKNAVQINENNLLNPNLSEKRFQNAVARKIIIKNLMDGGSVGRMGDL
jgi:hypothetical protein